MILKPLGKILEHSRLVFLLGLFAALLVFPGYRAYGCELEITGAGEDVQFSVWRIGEADKGSMVLSDKYEKYQADFDREDGIPQGTLALEGYLRRDRVPADAKAKTDESGKAAFSDLPAGIYLIGGNADEKEKHREIIEVQPVLVFLGGGSPEEWTIQAKVKRTPVPEKTERGSHEKPGVKTVQKSLTVRKIWEDKDGEERPECIVVDLLENNTTAATAVLTRDNGWKALFEGLSAEKAYTVAERDVPEGYVVALDLEGDTAVLTNRLREPVQAVAVLPSRLPQTGPILWPILILLPAGFLALFWGRRRKQYLCILFGILGLIWSMYSAGTWILEAKKANQTTSEMLREYDTSVALASALEQEIIPAESSSESDKDPDLGISVHYEDPAIWLLEIPALELRLPVCPDWSYEKLKEAPCVYDEGEDGDHIILCAHNYPAHFGGIGKLSVGDTARLNTGDVREYQVVSSEILGPEETGKLLAGEDWNLTLFTCTPGGAARVVVRLREVKEEKHNDNRTK